MFLEYFRTKSSRKPIRTIDLQESLNDSTESMDSLAQTPSSPQPSPALSPHLPFSTNQEMVANGNVVVRDTPMNRTAARLSTTSCCPNVRPAGSASPGVTACQIRSFPAPPPVRCNCPPPPRCAAVQVTCSALTTLSALPPKHTPPHHSPPKPTHLSDHHGNETPHVTTGNPSLLPRRTSLSGLELYRREFELSTKGHWNKRLSLNLPILLPTAVSESQSEDSYVPMASPTVSSSDASSDGYIPMSPTLPASLLTNGKADSPLPPVPDMEPPPVNRKLKPRIRVRPPPLDLRGLSTIREFPTHYPLIRTMTEPSASAHCIPLDRRWGWGLNGPEQEGVTPMTLMSGCDSAPWFRRSHLDYLSLDFNSASPSPVQKKPLLDEQRVDYVQVDEKKTQALQNTRTEWKDQRQSKSVTPGREEPGQRTEN
ncbi:hypothetical protein SRHO_G00284540 [Serrasalmus rhombeus]